MSIHRGTGIDSTVRLYLKGNGADTSTNFYDDSQSHRIPTSSGTTQISATKSKFGGTSIKFTNSKIIYPSTSDMDISSGEFCISFWLNSVQTSTQAIFDRVGGSPTNGITVRLITNGNIFIYSYDAGTLELLALIGPINDGNWHYVVVQRETAGVIKGYIDGTLKGTKTMGIGNPNLDLNIGNTVSGAYPYVGYLDDFIYQKSLTDGTKVPTRQRG